MKKQVYNLENIRSRYGRLTYPEIRDLGWTIINNRTTYSGSRGDSVVSCQINNTEYVISEPKVQQWLKDNNVKIRKSSVWFEEETA